MLEAFLPPPVFLRQVLERLEKRLNKRAAGGHFLDKGSQHEGSCRSKRFRRFEVLSITERSTHHARTCWWEAARRWGPAILRGGDSCNFFGKLTQFFFGLSEKIILP